MSVLGNLEVEVMEKKLGKVIHSMEHFVNHCWIKCKHEGKNVYTFSDFLAVMFDGNEEMQDLRNKTLYQYIMSSSPDEWRSNPVAKTANSFSDVYRVFWNSKRIHRSPSRNRIFRLIVDGDKKPILDDFGNKQFYFADQTGTVIIAKVILSLSMTSAKERRLAMIDTLGTVRFQDSNSELGGVKVSNGGGMRQELTPW